MSPDIAGLDFGAAPDGNPVVHAHLAGRRGCAAKALHQGGQGQVKQRRKRVRLQCVDRQTQLELSAAVGRDKSPFWSEDGNAFDQSAQELRARVEMNADSFGKAVCEHMVFNHLRRHAHQCQRVLVIAAVISCHVQCANHLAVGVDDGRA